MSIAVNREFKFKKWDFSTGKQSFEAANSGIPWDYMRPALSTNKALSVSI
jgi:hypothetical protein